MSSLDRRHCAVLGLLVVALAGRAGAAEGEGLARFAYGQTHMGSPFNLVLYTTGEPAARRASDAAFARVEQLNGILSDYDPDSELMRLCDRAGTGPVAVSDDLYRCLARALEVARASAGAFDPTINPVGRLWRRARRDRRLPDADLLAKAQALVGWENVRLDPARRTAELLRPGMKLDLGGIAKGFAAGEAHAVLKAHGVDRALVAAAGDIVVSGPPPGRDGWRIGIAPLDPTRPPERVLVLHDAAVSTSGDAERFVVIDGRRYGHIIDPRTGEGIIRRASVTVVARDGATADSLATAAFVLGPERGMTLVEATEGAAALFVQHVPDGPPSERATTRWSTIRQQQADAATPDGATAP
jgi:thiamine biosynthesis lipoprotein